MPIASLQKGSAGPTENWHLGYLHDPLTWGVCLVAVILIGLGKGGFAGLGALATPIASIVLPPVVATGILLPVLISQDLLSVWSFRREWDRWIIGWMLPGAAIGVATGWYFARSVDSNVLMAAVGVISILFAAQRLWIERGPHLAPPSTSPGWIGGVFGALSGFTSQVAHAGAPPFQMWVTPRRLPHTVYVGTNAVLFAAINLVKVPAYISLGALTTPVLQSASVLIPFALVTTYASLKLVRKMPSKRFYTMVYWVMLLLGVYLVARATTFA